MLHEDLFFKRKEMRILLVLFLVSFQNVYSQKIYYNLIAEYSFEFQPDSLDKNSKRKSENYILLTGKETSLFISSNRLALDTVIFKNAKLSDLGALMAAPQPTSNRRYIKSLVDSTVLIYDEISSTLYEINDLVNLNWTITNDTLHIRDIVLKKATTRFRGRNYIAWYSDEMPISDGPYLFKGLPGLIYTIADDKEQYKYELVAYKLIPELKLFDIDYSPKAKKISKAEFKKAREEFYNDPIPLMESEGAVFSDETKKIIRDKYRQRRKSSNNPIELTDE